MVTSKEQGKRTRVFIRDLYDLNIEIGKQDGSLSTYHSHTF